jgi:hypothetical protein
VVESEREARNLKCFVNYNARGTSSRCDNRKRGGGGGVIMWIGAD